MIIKIFCLIASIFSIFNNYIQISYKDDIDIKITEGVPEATNYQIDEEYIKFYLKGEYLFSLDDTDIHFDCLEKDDELYVTYILNNTLYFRYYTDSLKLKVNKIIDLSDKGIVCDRRLDIHIYGSYVYIFASLDNGEDIDLVCVKIDIDTNYEDTYVHAFYGLDNETYVSSVIMGDFIYLVVKKEDSLNSVFGTFNNYILSKVDLGSLDVTNNMYFKDEVFKYMYYKDECIDSITGKGIVLSFGSATYLINDVDMSLLYSYSYDDLSYMVSLTVSDIVMVFSYDNVILFDLNGCELENKTLGFSEYEVNVYDDVIYLSAMDKKYKLDLLDERYFFNLISYNELNSFDENVIYNVFNKCKIEYDLEDFDNTVFGRYEIDLIVLDSIGSELKKDKLEINVTAYENVIEGMIYPVNYKLFFNGKAYLNNKSIESGYEIKEEGAYLLSIIGNNNERRDISFSVSKEQRNVHTYAIYHDYIERSVYEKDIVSLIYNIDLEGFEIKDIIVNKESFSEYKYENKYLYLYFSYDKKGIVSEDISYLLLEKEGKEYKYRISERYNFNVIEKHENALIEIKEKEKMIEYSLSDLDNTYVGIRVYADNALYLTCPIKDYKIVLDKDSYSEFRICLLYLDGSFEILEEEVMSISLRESYKKNIGLIAIESKDNNLISFKISIDKDSIKSLNYLDKELYENAQGQKVSDNSVKYIIMIGIAFALCVLFAYLGKKGKKMRKK